MNRVTQLAENFKQSEAFINSTSHSTPYLVLSHALVRHARAQDTEVIINVLNRIGDIRSGNELNAGTLEGNTVRTLATLVDNGVAGKIINSGSDSEATATIIAERILKEAKKLLNQAWIEHEFAQEK